MGFTRCDASGCGKYFISVAAFDAHRTGEYGHAAFKKDGVFHPAKTNTRRCMTDEEMRAAGLECEERHGRIEWYIKKSREAWSKNFRPKNGTFEGETEEENEGEE